MSRRHTCLFAVWSHVVVPVVMIGLLAVACATGSDDAAQRNADPDDAEPPVISNGRYEPAELTWTDMCTQNFCFSIMFDVCDPGNNLKGGAIYVLEPGTSTSVLISGPILWEDYFEAEVTVPNVTNCDAPFEIRLPLYMFSMSFPNGPGDYQLSADVEVTDGSDNRSNRLSDLSLIIHYEG